MSQSCLNVTAENTIIDCNNFRIYGNNTDGAYAIYSNKNNTIIRNCRMFDVSGGIRIEDGLKFSVTNTTITNTVFLATTCGDKPCERNATVIFSSPEVKK